jgi:hypothetical protein
MSSPDDAEPGRWDLPNLERDLPTTAEDVAALARLRHPRPPTPEAYLEFLRQLGDPPAEVLRRRRGPRGEPFTLE